MNNLDLRSMDLKEMNYARLDFGAQNIEMLAGAGRWSTYALDRLLRLTLP